MTNIPLINTSEFVIVDDASLPSLEGMRWRLAVRRYKGGEWKYATTERKGGVILMHRLLAGAAEGQLVDHINGNGLDNRAANLRLCTHAQNMRNRSGSRFSASGVKGVHKYGNKWRAQIYVDGSRHILGLFAQINDAAAAYADAAKRLHGEFARITTAPQG